MAFPANQRVLISSRSNPMIGSTNHGSLIANLGTFASREAASFDLGSINLSRVHIGKGVCSKSSKISTQIGGGNNGSGDGGGGNGNGDSNGNGGNFDGEGGYWRPALSMATVMCDTRKWEEQEFKSVGGRLPEVRSFCCLNVGPVFEDGRWQPYGKSYGGNMDREGFYWRPCLLPTSMQEDIAKRLASESDAAEDMLAWARLRIEGWYQDQGYSLAKVAGFTGLSSGHICCQVVEGTIVKIGVSFKDKDGRDTHAKTKSEVIFHRLPNAVKEGMPYNTGAVKEAAYRVFDLGLFENVQVAVVHNKYLEGGINLDFLVEESPVDSAYIKPELSFLATDSGRPNLMTIQPGMTLSLEHRNIGGKNRTLQGYILANNLLCFQDDLRFKLEYTHPNIDGLEDPRDRTFRASCYNSRKLSAVFIGTRSQEHIPAVWVDRAGLKLSITESFSKQSKLMYGLVVEEVATRGEASTFRSLDPQDTYDAGLATGIDHIPFFQMNITRDNTSFINGARTGAHDSFQVDQGLALGGSATFFNRHQFATTRYIHLNRLHSPKVSSAVAILRARYGGILGDIPSCQAFTGGGPYSSRGYSTELANCRHFLELVGELRMPIQDNYIYGFAESFSELDAFVHERSISSLMKHVSKGAILAVGMKVGSLRTEYVFDCYSKTGSINLQLGERF